MGLASRVVLFVTVLGFALQSYITQTHIHPVPQIIGGIEKIADTKSPTPDKSPLDNSSDNCPLCQAVTHSGFFVVSATPILYVPFMWAETVAVLSSARADSVAATHDWQSRAPPRL
ncbi:MAG: hypothetical protein HY243_13570 [Proteobacteria bacterium]|nr:hypothetical protein [Pseudomonadota bacterium]